MHASKTGLMMKGFPMAKGDGALLSLLLGGTAAFAAACALSLVSGCEFPINIGAGADDGALAAGDACAHDAECVDGLACLSGTCTVDRSGDVCASDADCGGSFFCGRDGLCAPASNEPPHLWIRDNSAEITVPAAGDAGEVLIDLENLGSSVLEITRGYLLAGETTLFQLGRIEGDAVVQQGADLRPLATIVPGTHGYFWVRFSAPDESVFHEVIIRIESNDPDQPTAEFSVIGLAGEAPAR